MRLHCQNLVKRYGLRTVVKNVSIYVDQGEIVGLLGPNGAGKTTSFYMITGLIKPNNGKIFLDDEEVTSYPMYQRAQKGIGYLAQEASVFRKLSVEDNIMSVMELSAFTKAERKERMEKLIEEFGLQTVRKSYGIQLSGGERRRCEIARALALDPKFILLDERLPELTRLPWKIFSKLWPEQDQRHQGDHHRSQCTRDTGYHGQGLPVVRRKHFGKRNCR